MSYLTDEIASQPGCWSKAIELAEAEPRCPAPGERVAAVGCGSSLNVARAYAALREAAVQGETDAFPASEVPFSRRYDRRAVHFPDRHHHRSARRAPAHSRGIRTTAVTADPDAPLAREAGHAVLLDFADERSVVSSRFITAAIVLLRAQPRRGPSRRAARRGRQGTGQPAPRRARRTPEFTFLGRGWAAAVADEAALKLREASQTWAESYPALEYRHGPISVSDPGTVVWALGEVPPDLLADARRTGATVITPDADPLAALIGPQRLAAILAERKGLDPDRPRALTRSVILT